MKQIITIALALLLTGCVAVRFSDADRARVEKLNRQGISWNSRRPKGFKPVVKMGPAVGYSFLPGVNNIFIRNRVSDAKLDVDYIYDDNAGSATLRVISIICAWTPLGYVISFPFRLSGTMMDVHYVNNLALLRYMEGSAQ